MRIKNKHWAFMATTILASVYTAPALAQDNSGNSGEGNDIIVTARRTEEKLQDVPISITVMSQDALTKSNIYNAGDLGTYVPSLATNENFGPEKSSFSIRGFIQEGRTSPSVGVFFADVVAPRANTGTTSGNGAGVGSFMDLENLQVLKGPQGTLFGRNTTGGDILLVPKKPTDKLEGYIQASVGNYNMHRIEAVLNVPLSDKWRARAAVDWNQRDGYLNNISGIGPSKLGNTNYVAARLSIVGELTPNLENYTIFSYSRSNTYGNVAKAIACDTNPKYYDPNGSYRFGGLAYLLAPLGCAQIARAQASGQGFWTVENNDPHPKELQESWQLINTTTWRATDTLTVKNIISYAQFKEDSSFSLFGDNFQYPANFLYPGQPAGNINAITIESGPSGLYAQQSTFTEELQLQGHTPNNRFNWQAGFYLEVSKPLDWNSAYNSIFAYCTNAAAYQCTNALGFGSIFTANIKDSFKNKGFYAQGTYKLTDQLSLTGGIRYTIDEMTDDSRNININYVGLGVPVTYTCQNVVKFPGVFASGPNGPECDSVIARTWHAPTWLIDLDYKPSENLLLYAKYARGYRQGTIISGNLGLEVTNPEKVDTFEVGAKTSFHGAVPGYFNIAAFYNNFTNQQLSADAIVAPAYNGVIPPSQAIINAGKSRLWGIEVDSSVRPFKGMKVDIGYTYLNTKLISYNPPTSPFYSVLAADAAVGGPLAQSPKNRVTITATYTLPLDPSIGKIDVGGTFTHTDANQVHLEALAPNTYMVDAIDQLNLNVDWNSFMGHPIDLSFFMTNVTNLKRMVYPIASGGTVGTEFGWLNLPRMWGFRLKYRFGD